MIKTEIISANALKIVPPKKLKADDFSQIAPQVDSLILHNGQISFQSATVGRMSLLSRPMLAS
jgi:hypothetical protein